MARRTPSRRQRSAGADRATRRYRTERDSMGPVRVPADAYYGAQTQRAVENFPISGWRVPRHFIRALGLIKGAAAGANLELELLDDRLAKPIMQAAREVADGRFDEHFVVDIFQTGSGTSTNMNSNEIIARRAGELLGDRRGPSPAHPPIHPNDHVNKGQSSNDVIPTAIHVAALELVDHDLLPALRAVRKTLSAKARQFDRIVKIGRTHLQDATPIRLGQEFGGYARQIELALRRIDQCRASLQELAIGGTAVGTGINTHPQFAALVIARLNRETGQQFREAENHVEAQASRDAIVETSGALKTAAVSLMKIANDIRWLGSGPRCGIGELRLPEAQPGSSIMPGKINPVIAESVCQVAAQVIGYDATITVGGLSGNFELNVMMPVMAYDLLHSIRLLAAAAANFDARCLKGLKADELRCRAMIEQSLAMCTALAPVIGYDAAAAIAKEAYRSGKSVREIAKMRRVLPPAQLDKLLDPWRMTAPRASS